MKCVRARGSACAVTRASIHFLYITSQPELPGSLSLAHKDLIIDIDKLIITPESLDALIKGSLYNYA